MAEQPKTEIKERSRITTAGRKESCICGVRQRRDASPIPIVNSRRKAPHRIPAAEASFMRAISISRPNREIASVRMPEKIQGPLPPEWIGTGFGCILFPQTCEKIVLFLSLACGKFTRTLWRRCLTPHRGGV